jgi:hypothetical protein
MQVVTSKTRGSKSCGSSSKLGGTQVGKPRSIALVILNTSHQMVYQKWLLLVDTTWQDMVNKTVTPNDQRSNTHFQMRAMWNMQ